MYSSSLEARRVGRLVCVHSTTYTYWSDCGKQKSVQGRVGASKHKTTSTSPLRPVLFHLGQEEGRRIGYSSSRRRVYLVCQMLSAGWLYNVLHIPVMARYEYNNNNTVCSFDRSSLSISSWSVFRKLSKFICNTFPTRPQLVLISRARTNTTKSFPIYCRVGVSPLLSCPGSNNGTFLPVLAFRMLRNSDILKVSRAEWTEVITCEICSFIRPSSPQNRTEFWHSSS